MAARVRRFLRMGRAMPRPTRPSRSLERQLGLSLLNTIGKRIFSGGASIFMFHRILPSGEKCYEPELATSLSNFESVLNWLKQSFDILPLQDVAEANATRKTGGRPMCSITFDDGWVDNYLYAFPLLRARGIPATIFLPTRFIGTGRRFWQELLWLCDAQLDATRDKTQVIEDVARRFPWFPPARDVLRDYGAVRWFLMTRPTEEAEEFAQALTEYVKPAAAASGRAFVDWSEVDEMRNGGIGFGSHTLNHALLTQIAPVRAVQEIRESRRELQEHTGCDVPAFSYPWGAVNPVCRQAAIEAGYSYAVAIAPGGLAGKTDDPWLLPRIAISDSVMRAPGSALGSCVKSALLAAPKRMMQRRAKNENRCMKVAFVIDQIADWEGGTERQLRTLIESLDRRYFEPKLFFIFRDPNLPTETLPCAAEWVCQDVSSKTSFYSRVLRLTRALRKFRPDVVQTFFVEGIVAGTIAASLARAPAIVVSWRNAGDWMKLRHRIAFRGVAALADKWQPNSGVGWGQIRRTQKVSASRIELLPNALDLSKFNPPSQMERREARQQLKIDGKGPVFVSVAALVPVKDFKTLINGVKRIENEVPDAQFLIVGDGPLRQELEQHSRDLGLSHMIHFAGRQVDVRPYLAAADFAVLTSKSEGSSNSVLEYMAMGLPSVVSDIAPNRELVNGVFFASGNDSDLADKLLAITRDSALSGQLKDEYLNAVGQYSVEKCGFRAQSYYTNLVGTL